MSEWYKIRKKRQWIKWKIRHGIRLRKEEIKEMGW